MYRKSFVATLALLAAAALSGPAFAKPFTKVVSLSLPTVIGGAHLDAGDYWITVDGNKVTIVQDHKVVAQAEGRLQQGIRDNGVTIIVSEADGQLKEIHFDGGNQVLVMKSES
jgi:hypothetical protein